MAESRPCRGRCPRRHGLGRRRRPRSTLCGHLIRHKACETVAWLTSESVAYLLTTGCGSGSGKRPRATLGVSLPIRKSLCLGAPCAKDIPKKDAKGYTNSTLVADSRGLI